MKVVVTDGFTLNSGDLSWDDLKQFADIEIYDRTAPGDVIARCADAKIILTNKIAFTKDVLGQLPKLKLINVLATGYNTIDIEAARAKGIVVCNVPGYSTNSVAQHTFALILELVNQVGLHSSSVARGDWQRSQDFAYTLTPLVELSGKTMGLVGFGNIGQQTARIANAFGLKVIYHTPSEKETELARYSDLSSLFRESDIISLHLPLKSDNQEFVDKELIRTMKSTAYLINTSRGQLINEQDLAAALNEGVIAGAAIDVLTEEPPRRENPLLTAKNCIITPHNAWMSREARQRILEITYQNLKAFTDGKPVNVVN